MTLQPTPTRFLKKPNRLNHSVSGFRFPGRPMVGNGKLQTSTTRHPDSLFPSRSLVTARWNLSPLFVTPGGKKSGFEGPHGSLPKAALSKMATRAYVVGATLVQVGPNEAKTLFYPCERDALPTELRPHPTVIINGTNYGVKTKGRKGKERSLTVTPAAAKCII